MEYKALLELGFSGYEELAKSTVEEFKKLDLATHGQAPADEGFLTVWDEFKDQVQNGESVVFEAYEATFKQFIRKELDGLIEWELAVLWAVSERSNGFIWQSNYLGYEDIADAIEAEVYTRIYNLAESEEVFYQEGFEPRKEDEDEYDEDEEQEPQQLELF